MMRSQVEVKPAEKSSVSLWISRDTQEPILALQRPDKLILVTAVRPVVIPTVRSFSYSCLFFCSCSDLPKLPTTLNPYELQIETIYMSCPDIPTESLRDPVLKMGEIDNQCADLLESTILGAEALFEKHDNACTLIIKLIRQCTDENIRVDWANAILGINDDYKSSSILRL
ncbi:TPA: hypothetical protein ACPSKE_002637 [Legionella feeleii]